MRTSNDSTRITPATWALRRACLLLVAAFALLLSVGVAGAAAAEPPVWKVTATSEPTQLLTPRSEVIEMTVKGTKGSFAILSEEFGFIIEPYNVTAAELEAELEAEMGPGAVEVSGGPGDATGSKPYVLRFTGSYSNEELGLGFQAFGGDEISTKTLQAGGSGGVLDLTAINVGGPTDGSTVTISDSIPSGLTAVT
ncbi:MAG TPA: hypothetical protein VFU90_16250, partial [Candidatus Tumulicola sp.]|nr:hypothetical protein [Candidatus Tumulicola sp.]